jgi:hypothetical protein
VKERAILHLLIVDPHDGVGTRRLG